MEHFEAKKRDLSGLEWSSLPFLSEDVKTALFTEEGKADGRVDLRDKDKPHCNSQRVLLPGRRRAAACEYEASAVG